MAADPHNGKGEAPKPNLANADVKPVAGDGGPNDRAEKSKDKVKADDKPGVTAAPTKPEIELVDPSELVLGSPDRQVARPAI